MPATPAKSRTFFLTIEPHFAMTEEEAIGRLHSWLECYGYTSTDHGFNFRSVSAGIHRHKKIQTTKGTA